MQDAESAFGSDSSSVLEWKPAEPVDVASAPTTKKPLTALRVQVRDLSCFHSRWTGVKPVGCFSALQKEDKDSSTDLGYMTSEKAYRIVLAGDAAVGKSSFLLRLCKNEFKLASSATLGESQTSFVPTVQLSTAFQNMHWLVPLWVQEWISRWRRWSWTDSPFYCSCGTQQDKKGVAIIVLFVDLELQPTWLRRNTWSSSISSRQVSQHREVLLPACGRRVAAVWRHLWEELPKCARVGRHGWGKAPCSRRLCWWTNVSWCCDLTILPVCLPHMQQTRKCWVEQLI